MFNESLSRASACNPWWRNLALALLAYTGSLALAQPGSAQSLAAEASAGAVFLQPSTSIAGPTGAAFGGPATFEIAADLPNLRVDFVLTEMSHVVVSGGGVTTTPWATWETHSPAADEEQGGPYALPAPPANEVWPIDHANGLYSGLVLDGCLANDVFPVEFFSEIAEQEEPFGPLETIGTFSASDDSTLDSHGYWTFSYAIRATSAEGGVSDFHFKGIVAATCTQLESLAAPSGAPPGRIGDMIALEPARVQLSELGYAANEPGSAEFHCDGNTGRSCAKYKATCKELDGTPGCIPVQTVNGTNGSNCWCTIVYW